MSCILEMTYTADSIHTCYRKGLLWRRALPVAIVGPHYSEWSLADSWYSIFSNHVVSTVQMHAVTGSPYLTLKLKAKTLNQSLNQTAKTWF